MNALLPAVALCLFCLPVLSQTPSGQPYPTNEIWEAKYRDHMLRARQTARSGGDYVLPMVIHVAQSGPAQYISDSQLLIAFDWLNDAFANRDSYDRGTGLDTKIQFCLARRTPDNQPTNGIDRVIFAAADLFDPALHDQSLKLASAWDPQSYINVWVLPTLQQPYCPCMYNSYASDPFFVDPALAGIVIAAPNMGVSPEQTTQFAHELGHFLGLLNTFDGKCQNLDCLQNGDLVCDTPPDCYFGHSACGHLINSCETDSISGFASDQMDLSTNLMDHQNHPCANDFTEGQRARMELVITDLKASLLASNACFPPCLTPFSVDFGNVPAGGSFPVGSSLQFDDQSNGAASWRWLLDGAEVSTSQSAQVKFDQLGKHSIKLKVAGTDPNCAGQLTKAFDIVCPLNAEVATLATAFLAGQPAQFMPKQTAASLFQWSVDGAVKSTAKAFSFTPPALGEYKICLVIGNGLCADTACVIKKAECPTVAGFWANKTVLMPGQPVFFTNTSEFAGQSSWSVDGVAQSSANNFDWIFYAPGIHTVCLQATGAFCARETCKTVWVGDPNAAATEICGNGLDDDGDGLADCLDMADCWGFAGCDTVFGECQNLHFESRFAVKLAWRNDNDYVNAVGQPIVGNLDPQDGAVAEIIVPHFGGGKLLFFQGDGSDQASPAELPIPGGAVDYPSVAPSVADLDRDGRPELMIVGGDGLVHVFRNFDRAKNPAMDLWASSEDILPNPNWHIYPADFDGDGLPELYAGNHVFYFEKNNASGPPVLNSFSPLAADGHFGDLTSDFSAGNASSMAWDLLSVADCGGDPDCAGLEIAAGADIYSIDLDPDDGDPREIKVQRSLKNMAPGQKFTDGYTVVADLDLDGTEEVIFSGMLNDSLGIIAWNKNGAWTFFENVGTDYQHSTGMAAVANVFDDRTQGFATDLPEIIATSSYRLNCFNLNKAFQDPAKPFWWSLPTTDFSGYTGASTFDFNGDRLMEIVYRDENDLRVMYGGPEPFPTGVDGLRNWATYPAFSITADEGTVIADVDGDLQAEIVFSGNKDSLSYPRPNFGHIAVLEADESKFGPWLSARPIWNQYHYSVVNIEDDLTVPIAQMDAKLQLPPGSGQRPFLGSLFQRPLYKTGLIPVLPVPNAAISMETAPCEGQFFSIKVKICNTGDAPLRDSLPITFYQNGSPLIQFSKKLGSFPFPGGPIETGGCRENLFRLAAEPGPVFAFANDAGLISPPFVADSALVFAECSAIDNLAEAFLTTQSAGLDLGPDLAICDHGALILHAPDEFDLFYWQNGSTARDFTAFEAGLYWLQATDGCGIEHSDSVKIHIDQNSVLDLGPAVVACETADSVQLSVPGWAQYSWFPATGLSCTDCPEPILLDMNGAATYFLTVKMGDQCFGLDSLKIEPVPAPEISEERFALCPGDSVFVFDKFVHETGFFQKTIPTAGGCDSLHQVLVQFSALPTLKMPGDTTIPLGSALMLEPVFPQQTGLVFDWSPPDWVHCPGCPATLAKPLADTVFTLVMTDPFGCTASDRVRVKVKFGPRVFVPNAFSGGENPAFTIFANEEDVKMIASLQVFDRWGTQVFMAERFPPNEPQSGWDGTFRGKKLQPAVFVFWAKCELTDGTFLFLKGDLTLVD